jgi:type III secretion protein J
MRRLARLIALAALLCMLQACKTELYTNLSEREANSMVAALLHQGIPAGRVVQKDGRLTVTVAEDRFAEAMTILDEAGLPRQDFANLGQVFKSNGLVSSPVQERAQLIYALSEELAHTVSEVDGVVSARVHVVLPDNDLLKRNVAPSSASVFIRYEAGMDVQRLIPQIKTLVANGISGLSYDGVSVIPVEAAARSADQVAPPLKSFMGIWILASSSSLATLIFSIMALMILALAGALIYLIRRDRRPHSYALVQQP